jgi:hypothetical protein
MPNGIEAVDIGLANPFRIENAAHFDGLEAHIHDAIEGRAEPIS